MIALAHAKDMLTTPYVFSEDDAAAMAGAGADIVVCHMGLTTGGSIGAETALTLEQCPALVDAWAQAALRVNGDVIVLVHGGPVARPEDAQYVMDNAEHCHGFYGASSMERLPVESALTEQTRRFKGIARSRDRSARSRDPKRPSRGRENDTGETVIMSGSVIGAIVLWLIVAIIVIAVVVYLVNWLYRRSTKEVSFVRTGLGGEKVVINGGAFVLPIIHETTPVNMNVVQLEVVRDKENALITKDRMRVDMVAEFYVRVAPTREAVSMAAATLGRRTMEQVRLHELLSGKFIGALRSVGAEMTLEEMHEQRGDYVTQGEGGRVRGAGDERPGARIGRDHRARPDRPGVLQPLQPVRRRGSDAAHRGDRDPPQDAQRHRAGRDGPDPGPKPRSGEADARDRPRERDARGWSRSATSRSGARRSAPISPASAPSARPRPSRPRSSPGRRPRRRGSPTRRRSTPPASRPSRPRGSATSTARARSRRRRSAPGKRSRRRASRRSARSPRPASRRRRRRRGWRSSASARWRRRRSRRRRRPSRPASRRNGP